MTEVRVFKPEEKLRIPVEGLSGIIQISRLCEKYGMDTRQFYLWKKLLSSTEIFSEKGRKSTAHEREIRDLREENAKLKATIPGIMQENIEIKKKIGQRSERRGRT